jgi:hypothetical protein
LCFTNSTILKKGIISNQCRALTKRVKITKFYVQTQEVKI